MDDENQLLQVRIVRLEDEVEDHGEKIKELQASVEKLVKDNDKKSFGKSFVD